MSRCPGSPVKHRTAMAHAHTGGNYRHGSKGHVWKKLFAQEIVIDTNAKIDIHIGRQCDRCKKIVLNATGRSFNGP